MKSDPKPAQQDDNIDWEDERNYPIPPPEDDGDLDIEVEDNWVEEIEKLGIRPKEYPIPMDRALHEGWI